MTAHQHLVFWAETWNPEKIIYSGNMPILHSICNLEVCVILTRFRPHSLWEGSNFSHLLTWRLLDAVDCEDACSKSQSKGRIQSIKKQCQQMPYNKLLKPLPALYACGDVVALAQGQSTLNCLWPHIMNKLTVLVLFQQAARPGTICCHHNNEPPWSVHKLQYNFDCKSCVVLICLWTMFRVLNYISKHGCLKHVKWGQS